MSKNFEVIYQAAGAGTGKTVQMDVYKPNHSKDDDQSVTLDEIGSTGRYYGSFDADAADWSILVSDNAGGKCVKQYGKEVYDVVGVSVLVGNVQTAVDNAVTAIGTLQSLAETVDGKIDTVGTDIGTLTSSVGSLATALGIVGDKIDALEAPPQIG